ncbi:MAG: hypothetical protein RI910_2102 [Verrucomicrobiota bacterium]
MVRERCGRFIHKDDVGPAPKGLGNLHNLSLGHGQRAHQAGRADIGFKFAQ